MIKQSFLNSLKGLPVTTAEEMVKSMQLTAYVVPEGVHAIPLIAMPNTVVLWQKNGKVVVANGGDGVEVDEHA
jgi:hypothetical protein